MFSDAISVEDALLQRDMQVLIGMQEFSDTTRSYSPSAPPAITCQTLSLDHFAFKQAGGMRTAHLTPSGYHNRQAMNMNVRVIQRLRSLWMANRCASDPAWPEVIFWNNSKWI